MQSYTHQIIRITAARTQYGDRMWRCATRDGNSVAIFSENKGRPGSLHRFGGYIEAIEQLNDGESLRWTEHPIEVVLSLEGKYFNVVAVAARPDGSMLDVLFVPEPHLCSQAACQWAQGILASDAVIWDTETTGTDLLDDEIISIGIVYVDGTVLLNQIIRPLNLERNAESGAQTVNGLTPDVLANAPTFSEVYPAIRAALQGQRWVTYNTAFDTVILERDCLRHELIPVTSSGITCAMEWYARFHREWDAGRQSYTAKKLVDAAQTLDVEVMDAHHALGDSLTTLEVIRRMAEGVVTMPIQT